MGSCISTVLANIFMEYIERQALTILFENPLEFAYVMLMMCFV